MSIESEIKRAITYKYDIEIKYEKYNGETSKRKVSNISYNNDYKDYGYNNDHIKGYCHLRNEERTFRISRITAVRVLPLGEWVSIHSLSNFNISSSKYSYSSNKSSSESKISRISSNEGCYIATMVYGSYEYPQVMILRWYRDNVLQKNLLGQLFIRTYYFSSPKLVAVLKGHDKINRTIRYILDKQIQRIKKYRINKKK